MQTRQRKLKRMSGTNPRPRSPAVPRGVRPHRQLRAMPNPHQPTALSPLLIHPTGFLESPRPCITKNAVVVLHHCIQPRVPCITKARITEFAAHPHTYPHPASCVSHCRSRAHHHQENALDLAAQSCFWGTLILPPSHCPDRSCLPSTSGLALLLHTHRRCVHLSELA